ncbi:MAG: hypothetical protein NTY19_12785 [Planctomycetota bacterium]|nr:hypothetical protein [Planctomycetota bacterium]
MLKFGLVGEGPIDQTVMENILLGYFEKAEDERIVNYIEPPRPLTDTPAGWGHVFKWLERRRYEGALQYLDYLVIHIDTDVQEEGGFDVPRAAGGKPLSVPELVDRVINRLKKEVDPAFCQANSHRILFAIAVRSIECWLLPLLYLDKKAAKITGCEESANHALRKADRNALSAGGEKFLQSYEDVSSEYRKRKRLMHLRDKNPSLELFIQQLDDLQERLIAEHLSAGGERDSTALPADAMPGNHATDPSS